MPKTTALDTETTALVRVAAAIASGSEAVIGEAMTAAMATGVDAVWMEELLLQSILMTGYPRALVAFGLWRTISGTAAPEADADAEYTQLSNWEARGVETCSAVYGDNYAKLRQNVQQLHPAVDRWMLVEGYGRTLGRRGLDLRRRELCTVAQTAVLRTHRQLHSHLRGALHGGATVEQVDAVLGVARPLIDGAEWQETESLWAAVRAGWTEES